MSHMIVEVEKKPAGQALNRKLTKNWLVWVYGLTMMASFTIFVVFWCTNTFRDALLSTLELRNGSSAFRYWQKPPVSLMYKIYIFNYTNIQEFERGEAEKLRVQEVGPYIYREKMRRINAKVHDNNTVTYQEQRNFYWENGRPDDETVIVPNVPLLGAVAFSRDLNFVFSKLLSLSLVAILPTPQAKAFLEIPAGEFLWGYDDKLFQVAKPLLSFKQDLPFEKFGILAFKNGTNHDRITVHTGVGDMSSLGVIQLINGKKERGIWGHNECDEIHGTDGSIFPPEWTYDHNSTLYVYAKDVCRKIAFRYHDRASVRGIPTYRYKLQEDSFTATPEKNSCYCPKASEDDSSNVRVCPPAGVFNFSSCQFGFPILASLPHFYTGDPSLFENIDGLNPQQELHETYMDVHQKLGLPIGGWWRFQLNVEVRRAGGMTQSGKLKDGMILPLIWVDTAVGDIPDQIVYQLYQAHYLANAVEACLQWCSLIAIFLSFGAFIVALRKDRETEHTCLASIDSMEQTKLPE